MSACHTKPFIASGVSIAPNDGVLIAPNDGVLIAPNDGELSPPSVASAELCDYCGVATLEWRKCKLICTSCRQINKSCADL